MEQHRCTSQMKQSKWKKEENVININFFFGVIKEQFVADDDDWKME